VVEADTALRLPRHFGLGGRSCLRRRWTFGKRVGWLVNRKAGKCAKLAKKMVFFLSSRSLRLGGSIAAPPELGVHGDHVGQGDTQGPSSLLGNPGRSGNRRRHEWPFQLMKAACSS